jgi:hypothetical protein
VLLYLYSINKVFLEGTTKSLTAFFRVYLSIAVSVEMPVETQTSLTDIASSLVNALGVTRDQEEMSVNPWRDKTWCVY